VNRALQSQQTWIAESSCSEADFLELAGALPREITTVSPPSACMSEFIPTQISYISRFQYCISEVNGLQLCRYAIQNDIYNASIVGIERISKLGEDGISLRVPCYSTVALAQ
jgi:hypothetical protein